MANFKPEDFSVFKRKDLSVVMCDSETIKVEGKEVTVVVKDLREKLVVDFGTFILGFCCGFATLAGIFFAIKLLTG